MKEEFALAHKDREEQKCIRVEKLLLPSGHLWHQEQKNGVKHDNRGVGGSRLTLAPPPYSKRGEGEVTPHKLDK